MSTLLDLSAPDRVLVLADVILRLPSVGILIVAPADLGKCVPCTYSARPHGQHLRPAVADVVDRHSSYDPERPFAFGHTPTCVEHLASEVAHYHEVGAVVHVEIPISPKLEAVAS